MIDNILPFPPSASSSVTAEVEVSTPTGRRFHYRVSAVANDLGIATLRVPYATDTDSPTRPTGPYRVRFGERIRQVSVSDADQMQAILAGADRRYRDSRRVAAAPARGRQPAQRFLL